MSLRIEAIRLLCPDPARTARFYETAFGCRIVSPEGGIDLAFGEQRLELAPTDAVLKNYTPSNATSFQHCAIVVTDMRAAYQHLQSVDGWTAISRGGPVLLPPGSGGVQAFKFRDPDGHPLELLCFPPASRPGYWRREGLFLGIDHSAITVSDTQRSVAFYAGLGFTLGARTLNRGEEQGRLDDLVDPVVEVTALETPGGAPPHLELLAYREPTVVRHNMADDDVLATRLFLTPDDRPRADHEPVDQVDPDGHRSTIRSDRW